MRRRLWPWLVLFGTLAVGAWLAPKFVSLPVTVSEGYEPFGPPMSHPVTKVVKDDRTPLRIDLGWPWRIEFGRGSGWHGLDTIKLDHDGRAVFHWLQRERKGGATFLSWETSTTRLPRDVVAKVLEAVEVNRLLELDKSYYANVHDGTQWVLWVRQGEREKVVYFDNHFPDSIVRFAEQLDAIVSGSVGPSLRWRAVPYAQARDHEQELWDSIHR
jgi:hypothetical protein